MNRKNPLRVRGQALVLALALLLVGSVGLFMLFSTEQSTSDKARLINAADASAYSASLWQARALNYQAYANRAIVVTEVHLAQEIALAGWTRFVETFSIKFDDIADVIVFLKPFAAMIREIATTVADVFEQVTDGDVQARAAEGYGYKNLLHTSQQVMNSIATDMIATNAVVTEVARATDQRFFAWAIDMPEPIARSYDSLAERRRFAKFIMQSAPDFVAKPRSAEFDELGPIGGSSGVLDCMLPEMKKRGATVLSDDLQRWESADTASIHRRNDDLFGGSCTEAEPVGWGGAEATDKGFEDRITTGANGMGDNRRARDKIGQPDYMWGIGNQLAQFDAYSGVTGYQDLDYANLGENRRFPTRATLVLARMRKDRLRTANNLNVGVGRLRQFEHTPKDYVYALAAGEVYFKRPASSYADAGAPVEYATLFNPYWQARLRAVSDDERIAALNHGASAGAAP